MVLGRTFRLRDSCQTSKAASQRPQRSKMPTTVLHVAAVGDGPSCSMSANICMACDHCLATPMAAITML